MGWGLVGYMDPTCYFAPSNQWDRFATHRLVLSERSAEYHGAGCYASLSPETSILVFINQSKETVKLIDFRSGIVPMPFEIGSHPVHFPDLLGF